MFKSFINKLRDAGKSVLASFKPAEILPPALPTSRPSWSMPRFWWRADCFTPQGRHGLQNNKALMYNENTLLQGLLLRHFKEVA